MAEYSGIQLRKPQLTTLKLQSTCSIATTGSGDTDMPEASTEPPPASWEFPYELYALLNSPPHRPAVIPISQISLAVKFEATPPTELGDLKNKHKKRTKLGDLSSVFAAHGWREPDAQSLSSQSSDDSSSEDDDESYNTSASSPPDDDSDHHESTRKKKVTWTDELEDTPIEPLRRQRKPLRIRNSKGHLVTFETEKKRWKIISPEGEDVITVEHDEGAAQPIPAPQVPIHLRSTTLPSATYLLPASITPSAPPKVLYDPGVPNIVVDPNIIKPLLYLSRAEKKLRIVKRLITNGGIDRSLPIDSIHLSMYDYGGNISSDGVHIFVDSSNITINFQQVLRKSRKLDPHVFLKSAPLSFHSLSMIMERFRSVAKRVLVGSSSRSDRIPDYMYQAERCGYEVSNLARVEKLKIEKDTRRSHTGTGSGYGTGSGSEGPTSVFKVSEQGVDEILHLKMMESLCDYEPSTLVLATGDAAEAEYSGGFLVMIERAMKRGWKVELVAWRQGMSYAYRSKEFLEKWAGKFTIVYLDEFAEELLAIYRAESK